MGQRLSAYELGLAAAYAAATSCGTEQLKLGTRLSFQHRPECS